MLVDIIFISIVIGLLLAIYKIKFKKDGEATQRPIILDTANEAKRGATWAAAGTPQQISSSSQQQEEAVGVGNRGSDMRKQLRKDEKARQKQRRKEARQQQVGHQRQKREQEEEEEAERDRIEEEKRQKEEECYAMLMKEEEEKKKAEYDRWKGMFVVETSGKGKESAEEELRKRNEFLHALEAKLTRSKLSLLEDLAHFYKLSTKEVIEDIKELEEQGRVKGIFDERGKYMVIEEGEWEAIRNYVSARGRVKKTDIMQECARIIKIPDQEPVDQEILGLIDSQQGHP